MTSQLWGRLRIPGHLVSSSAGIGSFTVFTAVVAILTTRWLPPTNRGELIVVLVLSNLLAIASSGGVGVETRNRMGKGERFTGWRPLSTLLVFTLGASLALAVVVGIPVLWLTLRDATSALVAPFVVLTVLQAALLYLRDLLFGSHRVSLASNLLSIAALVQMLGVIVLEVLGALTVTSALVVSIGGTLLAGVVTLLVLHTHLNGGLVSGGEDSTDTAAAGAPDITLSRGLAEQGFRATPAALRFQIPGTASRLMLALIAGPALVAFYGAAITYVGISSLITTAAGLIVQQAGGSGKNDTNRVVIASLVLQTISVVLLVLLAPWLIPAMFGAEYADIVDVTWLAGLATLALALLSLNLSLKVGQERYRAVSVVLAFQTITIVGFQLLLVPRFELVGAIVALLASAVLSLILLYLAVRHRTRVGTRGSA